MAEYTVEDYRAAARRAYDAGNIEAAEELAQAGMALQGSMQAEPKDEIDTFGEYAGDVAGAAAAGLGRGAIGTLELPEMAGRVILRAGQEALQAAGFDVGENLPILDTKTGRVLRSGVEAVGLGDELDYRGQTTAGKFAGTIAEFAGGAGALGATGKVAKATGKAAQRLSGASPVVGRAGESLSSAGSSLQKAGLSAPAQTTAVIAGAGSEAAGQALEGSPLEPVARVIGALAAPTAVARSFNLAAKPYDSWIKPSQIMKEVKTGNEVVDATLSRAISKPSSETQYAFKNTAYREADKVGDVFTEADIIGLYAQSDDKLKSGFAGRKYDVRGDGHIQEAMEVLEKYTKGNSTLMNIDDMKQQVRAKYAKGIDGRKQYDPRIKTILDDIDELIEAKAEGSSLLNAARLGHVRTKKLELLEDALGAADKEVKAGASIVTRYKAAIKKLSTNKKDKSYFTEDELAAMDGILEGNLDDKVLRQFGKLSPLNGLNLMTVISNLGMGSAVAAGVPYAIPALAGSIIAKPISEAMIKSQIKDLNRFLATGSAPTKFKPQMAPRTLGLAPQLPQEQQ